jgi:hypothetical protein
MTVPKTIDRSLNEELLARTSGMALQKGDRVDVNNGPFGHWGEGTIDDISDSDYGGSKLFPVFHVVADDGTSTWMSAIALTKV